MAWMIVRMDTRAMIRLLLVRLAEAAVIER